MTTDREAYRMNTSQEARPAPILRFCRNDLLVVLGILVAAAVTAFFVFRGVIFPAEESQQLCVVVLVDGVESGRYPLTSDTVEAHPIITNDGNLTVRVGNGKASVIEASCPDHICMLTGEISSEGQTIVCLPMKTVVRIEAIQATETLATNSDQPDASIGSSGESIDAISQ